MSDTPERVRQAATLDAIGSDVRGLARFASGPVPLVRPDVAQPVVALLAGGRSVLLVGESGCGKTMLARSLPECRWPSAKTGQLRLTESGPVPAIVETHPAKFQEGCYYADHLENKVALVVVNARARDAILFIDEIDAASGAGSSSNNEQGDVATLLTPHVGNGLRVLGATTPAGLARLRARNPRFVERFEVVEVPEPAEDETRAIVAAELAYLKRRDCVTVTDDAASAALTLARRHMPGRPLVSGALALARRAAHVHARVDRATLRAVLAEVLGVRPCFVGGQSVTHEQLVAVMGEHVFGQEAAVTEVADALLRYAAGLNEGARPIGAFLMVGPSGVGKTSLALAAAEALTGDAERVARFDMSEYADPYAASRLIADDAASLAGKLRGIPAGVVLLDEIEKAHISVIRLMLQALGEARLTSEGGWTARLDNHLVLFTSNLGSHRWNDTTPLERIRRGVLADCVEFFPPEFLGRLTQTLLFAPLTSSAAFRVVTRELERLNDLGGLQERGIQLLWPDELPWVLARASVTKRHGARGVQRVVRSVVVSPLARWLAAHADVHDACVMLAPHTIGGELESVVIDRADDEWLPVALIN